MNGNDRLIAHLGSLVGAQHVLDGRSAGARYAMSDATVSRRVSGNADAVVVPGNADEVAAVVAWCYGAGIPITARGGGTGYAGGAVPRGGVLLDTTRLDAIREFSPELWRMQVEAGVRTATVHRLARENGLMFPPDPGASEDSTIGGNVTTNAGGPHAFKYGSTGSWVTGIEAVLAPGELVAVGGPFRKDVAGYDISSLLVGSEGTLGIVTATWLRLIPAPEVVLPVAALYPDVAAGCRAVERVLGFGIRAAALEFLDGDALAVSAAAFPKPVPAGSGFLVIAEADGSEDEARRLVDDLAEALGEHAVALHRFETRAEIRALWRWRDGVSLAVTASRGGKLSEDIVVPLDRLEEAIRGTALIGERHGLPTCSWGHAGDGNLHSSFLIDASDADEVTRAERAAAELFGLALELGGSISGEHGVGLVKNGFLARQWPAHAAEMHTRIKEVFDPRGLLNPGKKLATRPTTEPAGDR